MPAFTSAEALAAWHPDARPVAVYAARAALSAVAEGAELLVLDPGSESHSLSAGRPSGRWPSSTVAALLRGSGTGRPMGRQQRRSRRSAVSSSCRAGEWLPAQPHGAVVAGGGAGPELKWCSTSTTAWTPRSPGLVSGLQAEWSRNVLFGERVDSLEVKLRRAHS